MQTDLASFLDLHRDRLMETWRQRVTGPLNPQHEERSEIIDTLPAFIEEIIGKLLQGNGADIAPSAFAPAHGAQRFHAGFSLGTVIREYRVFQDCIFDLLREKGCQASTQQIQATVNCVMTAIAEAAQEFGKARDQAILREKDQHLAFLAHELRNPLSSVRLAMDIIGRSSPPPPAAALDRASRNLNRLSALVDQAVVDVRVRSLPSDFPLHKERIPLSELIDEVVADTAGDIEAKSIELTVRVPKEAIVDADRRLIYSVLANLMRNAVKFTPRNGRVLVQAHMGEAQVMVEVEDGCGGLPDGKVEELFTPYVQKGRDRSGFGLGLAIAKQAVEAHGGTIEARNLSPKGCVFAFELPMPAY